MDNVNCMERFSNFHHHFSRRMFRGRCNRHRWCSRPTPKSAALMHKSRVAQLLLPDTIVGYLSRAGWRVWLRVRQFLMHTMAAYFTAGLRFVMGQIVSGLSTLGAVAWLGCGYITYTYFDCVVIVYGLCCYREYHRFVLGRVTCNARRCEHFRTLFYN